MVAALALSLAPAQPPAAVLASGAALAIRRALAASAADVPGLVVRIRSITYGPTGEELLVAQDDPVNTADRRLLSTTGRALQPTNATTVIVDFVMPPAAPSTQLTAITDRVAAIVAGTDATTAASLTQVSVLWGNACGAPPQAVGLAAIATTPAASATPQAASGSLSGGGVGGIVVAGIVLLCIAAGVVYWKARAHRSIAAAAGAGDKAPTGVEPVMVVQNPMKVAE